MVMVYKVNINKFLVIVKHFINEFIIEELIIFKLILKLIDYKIKLLVKQLIVKELFLKEFLINKILGSFKRFKQVSTMIFGKMNHMTIINFIVVCSFIDFMLKLMTHMVENFIIINELVMCIIVVNIINSIINSNIRCFVLLKLNYMFKLSQHFTSFEVILKLLVMVINWFIIVRLFEIMMGSKLKDYFKQLELLFMVNKQKLQVINYLEFDKLFLHKVFLIVFIVVLTQHLIFILD